MVQANGPINRAARVHGAVLANTIEYGAVGLLAAVVPLQQAVLKHAHIVRRHLGEEVDVLLRVELGQLLARGHVRAEHVHVGVEGVGEE